MKHLALAFLLAGLIGGPAFADGTTSEPPPVLTNTPLSIAAPARPTTKHPIWRWVGKVAYKSLDIAADVVFNFITPSQAVYVKPY